MIEAVADEAQKQSLTPERRARVLLVVEQALLRPKQSRVEFVRHTCAGDEELIREVQSRLNLRHESGNANAPGMLHGSWSPSGPNGPGNRAGTVLKSRYRIQRRLGAGGLGVVYLAEDLNLGNRPVVVKFLHDYGEPDPARVRKFRQEIETLARIDHPGVVTAFDAGETHDATPFIVMQYVEGETLRHLIDAGPLPLERAASILRQLGDALQAAHDKRIIHRDLKPENVMLQRLGSRDIVKLIDFGIARIDESRGTGDTAVLTVAGTPSYMAPEQISGRPEVASDIFSLGVIAYEMLVGKRPFPSRHPYQLRQQHRAGMPRGAMRKLNPDVPAAAETAIRHALCYEPQDRPARAKDWCDSVADALARRESPMNRRRMLYSLSGIGGAALSGAAWWGFRGRMAAPLRGPVIAEHKGGLNPLAEGFRISGDLTGTAVRNGERTGFDRFRIDAREQGDYFMQLTPEEKREALRRGWKMTVSGYPEIGGLHAVADFLGAGPRFDINLFREKDGRLMVMTCTQHVPVFVGPLRELSNAPHRCELTYDPVNASCDLYVDGTRIITAYKGHNQQRSGNGFFFGASVWKSDRAQAFVDLARFELL